MFFCAGLGGTTTAEKRIRETLEIQTRTLGDHHPDTINSQMSLAITLTKQGNFDEAESLYRQALEFSEETLGPGHLDTLNIVGNLGNLFGVRPTLRRGRGRPSPALPAA